MGDNLASLYIHIPFCAEKCGYCDFYSLPVGRGDFRDTPVGVIINRYISAVAKEWAMREDAVASGGHGIDTIYIGGGTPSLLGVDLWERLDRELFSGIDRAGIKEWSIECNPESFSMDKAKVYSKSGVTRLTFGVQSLNDRELSLCGRVHDSARALEVISDKRLAAMFGSIGVDIIYGLPGQTLDTLNDTLSSVLSIPHVSHLSAYELTVAKDTPFGRRQKTLPLPDEDAVAEMYRLIGNRCAERGMAQYEVSNYALAGHESAHNKAYWTRKPYIGLGASAHSYIHPKRWGNVRDVEEYMSLLSSNDRPIEFEEVLTDEESMEEKVFLGLRNIEGVDKREFEDTLREYVNAGYLIDSGERLIPTPKGMLFADMMATRVLAPGHKPDCKRAFEESLPGQ
jgi:oxygen-independent coproporphyrinogen-3 oxidase